MYVLFIVLNEIEYMSDILQKMKQLGIRGATVIDSMGARTLENSGVYRIPFVGGLIRSLNEEIRCNKTLFSVIEREEQVEHAMEEIEKILGGDMTKPDKGIMFVLPVVHMRGGELNRHIESRESKKNM
jgi:hypothetical protein